MASLSKELSDLIDGIKPRGWETGNDCLGTSLSFYLLFIYSSLCWGQFKVVQKKIHLQISYLTHKYQMRKRNSCRLSNVQKCIDYHHQLHQEGHFITRGKGTDASRQHIYRTLAFGYIIAKIHISE